MRGGLPVDFDCGRVQLVPVITRVSYRESNQIGIGGVLIRPGIWRGVLDYFLSNLQVHRPTFMFLVRILPEDLSASSRRHRQSPPDRLKSIKLVRVSQSLGLRAVEASDRSLLLVFGDEISLAAHREVLRLTPGLRAQAGVTNVHPAYASILIDFDPLETTHGELERAARKLDSPAATPGTEPRMVEIPVSYGAEYGPDLEDVAALNGLSAAEVIAAHSGAEYLVYFLGFAPGFPYLGGMPESIAAPRLETPRPRVPAGSVAIGGRQTGVYPVASPGGWRIIGRTPLRLFEPQKDPPVLLRMGDHVKFVPMAKGTF
jgi:KipI family sensor histidine kinase inhibitor